MDINWMKSMLLEFSEKEKKIENKKIINGTKIEELIKKNENEIKDKKKELEEMSNQIKKRGLNEEISTLTSKTNDLIEKNKKINEELEQLKQDFTNFKSEIEKYIKEEKDRISYIYEHKQEVKEEIDRVENDIKEAEERLKIWEKNNIKKDDVLYIHLKNERIPGLKEKYNKLQNIDDSELSDSWDKCENLEKYLKTINKHMLNFKIYELKTKLDELYPEIEYEQNIDESCIEDPEEEEYENAPEEEESGSKEEKSGSKEEESGSKEEESESKEEESESKEEESGSKEEESGSKGEESGSKEDESGSKEDVKEDEWDLMDEFKFKHIMDILIETSTNQIKVHDNIDNKDILISDSIDKVIGEKEEIFKNNDIQKILDEKFKGKILAKSRKFFLMKKINPVILYSLSKTFPNDKELVTEYIESLKSKRKFDFNYTIDLRDSKISDESFKYLRKIAKKEMKIPGTDVKLPLKQKKKFLLFGKQKETPLLDTADGNKSKRIDFCKGIKYSFKQYKKVLDPIEERREEDLDNNKSGENAYKDSSKKSGR